MILWAVIAAVVAIAGYAMYSLLTPSSDNATSQAASAAATTGTPTDQVQINDVSIGDGAEAVPGSNVAVLYVGKLTDGTVFDASSLHNNEPLAFQLGSDQMIPGFQIGVNGMKVGGQRVIAIPPSLGYGPNPITNPQTGEVLIPGNSTLVFEIQLVAVEQPAATQ